MDGMDFQALMTMISTVGFPIVACCGLFYLYNRTIKDITAAITEINVTMKTMMNMMNKDQ